MENQESFLNGLGIGVLNISPYNASTIRQLVIDIINKKCDIKLIYLSPEKLSLPYLLKELHRLYKEGLWNRIVIDEAHCVSKWGRSFRNDYLTLSILREEFPDIPILALTATATSNTLKDCIQSLKMNNDTLLFVQSINRPNLFYEVRKKEAKVDDIKTITNLLMTRFFNKSGIIYCQTKKITEMLTASLRSEGLEVEAYHSGVDLHQRKRILKDWIGNISKIIVATIALGMGIDKPDVRFVIHYGLSKVKDFFYISYLFLSLWKRMFKKVEEQAETESLRYVFYFMVWWI